MEVQLRIYRIAAGHLDEFVEAWQHGVKPLRETAGFVVTGAWTVPETNDFVWILSYDGDDTFADADARYYASPDRARLSPDPAGWIESTSERAAHRVI